MTQNYADNCRKLENYFVEFLSRSKQYQEWLKFHDDLIQVLNKTSIKLVPAKVSPGKKQKPLKPNEINKPRISSSASNKQHLWNITHKFICNSNRLILEVDIEKPEEILNEQFKKIISVAQQEYWREMQDENWHGQYRYLVDFKRDIKGRKDTYPFEEWDRYLKVYDLKTEGKSFRMIAQIIFNDTSDSSVDKIKKSFKKSKCLIAAAEENKFPPQKK